MTIILFLIVLAVLIFVHELGHFLAARACGIRVDEFALGFGPSIWSIKKGETRYALNIVPFGGYVKIFGENPDEESMRGPDSARSFVNKPRIQQVIVLVAGVAFNFLFAWLILSYSFFAGVPASLESYSEYKSQMNNIHIAVTYVEPKSPADIAGLKAGDSILDYDSVEKVQNAIAASADKGVMLHTIHQGDDKKITIFAKEGIVENKYAIGISMDEVGTLKLPFFQAFYEGTRFTFHMMKEIALGLGDLVFNLFKGSAALSQVTGPVGIAGLVNDAAQLGFTYLLMFTALISINLGVLNLVPFPALDGGRVLFVIIEAIIRRQIKPAFTNVVNAVGFALLLLLMIVVTFKDIAKLFIN
jgi:regulator of sigma E protease